MKILWVMLKRNICYFLHAIRRKGEGNQHNLGTYHEPGIVCVCVCVCVCLTPCNPMDCIPPAPLSTEFFSQEYWSGLPFPPSGDLPYPEIKPMSPALASGFFTPDYMI